MMMKCARRGGGDAAGDHLPPHRLWVGFFARGWEVTATAVEPGCDATLGTLPHAFRAAFSLAETAFPIRVLILWCKKIVFQPMFTCRRKQCDLFNVAKTRQNQGPKGSPTPVL
jgi:hypothetical protein